MIKCNLAVLLAERNMKISEVSKRTGISRTTLTALSQNQSKGIQFDTFDTLCTYLKISPDDLFIQETLEYDFSVIEIDDSSYIGKTELKLKTLAEIQYKNNQIKDTVKCDVKLFYRTYSHTEFESMTITPHYPDTIIDILNSIPITFKTSLEQELIECLKAELVVQFAINEDIEAQIW